MSEASGTARAAFGWRVNTGRRSDPGPALAQAESPPAASSLREVEVCVQVARGGFVKRRESGTIDFISPLPCPFNYGSVAGTLAADGDPEDALVLGPRLATGTRVRASVLGRVQFIDAGLPDPKWVCGQPPLRAFDRARVELFFRGYTLLKRALNAWRGLPAPTRYQGFERWTPGSKTFAPAARCD